MEQTFFFPKFPTAYFFKKVRKKNIKVYAIFLNLADKILLGSNIFYFVT